MPIRGGSRASEVVTGTNSDDTVWGGRGDDTLNGLAGDDLLSGGAGADELNGGAGADTADYGSSNAAVSVTLGQVGAGGHAAGDRLNDIENLAGSSHNDALTGDSSPNWIWGRAGNDTIYGNAGVDRLHGEGGHDDIFGGSGDDHVRGYEGNDELSGGAGSDKLVGNAGADRLRGEAGNDTLWGGAGNDVLDGGGGNDTIEGGAGGDEIDGGDGRDLVSYRASDSGVTVNLGADTYGGGHASGDDLDSIEEVRGSNHGDVLTGSSAAEKLMGAPGNDSVSGAGGNDTLWGGQGDDTLSGGAGNDTLAGGAGSDTFEFSAAGSDFIEAFEQGSDKINIPGLTATQLDALLLTRTAVGTRFQYRHDGLTINTNVQLAASDFVGFAGAPAPAPGSGTPTGNIVGTNGDDVRDGGPGDDTINGLDGNDDLIGRDGDDVLIGGAGFDTLHGWDQDKLGDATRDGIDTASYEDAPTRVIVTLHTAQARTQGGDEAQEWDSDIGGAGDDALSDPGVGMPGAGHARGDVFYSIENLRGSKYHDTLQGDDSVAGDDTGDNKIEGLEGNDHITGLGGNDTLIGGEGHDSLHGGAGDDSLEGGPGEDTLYGAGGDDVLYGGAGADMLCGEDTGTGNDTLVGGEGADTLWGGIASYMGSAAVTINLNDDEPEKGGHAEGDVLVGDDTVTANDVVHIIGSSGHDWLRSRTLSGTAETLEGGDGNDTLVGGDGSDLLDGGEGTDTASYNLFTDSVPDGAQTGNLVVLGEPQTTRVNLTGTGGILRNIENLIGSWGNDTLTGNSGRNKIEGIQGDDTIEGKGGADTLDGGEGTDTLLYETSPEAVTITVSGSGSGSASGAADSHARGDTIKDFEVVIGSDHNDVLRATGSESVTLDGGAGEDTLRGGGSEPVTLNGGTDDDVFYFRNGDTVQDFAAGDKIDLPGSRSSWGKHVHVDSGVLYYDSSGRLFIPEVRNDQGDVTTPEDLTGLPAGFDLSTLPSMTVTGLTSEDDGNFM